MNAPLPDWALLMTKAQEDRVRNLPADARRTVVENLVRIQKQMIEQLEIVQKLHSQLLLRYRAIEKHIKAIE